MLESWNGGAAMSAIADALDDAKTCGITVVSMTRDWSTVFAKA